MYLFFQRLVLPVLKNYPVLSFFYLPLPVSCPLIVEKDSTISTTLNDWRQRYTTAESYIARRKLAASAAADDFDSDLDGAGDELDSAIPPAISLKTSSAKAAIHPNTAGNVVLLLRTFLRVTQAFGHVDRSR